MNRLRIAVLAVAGMMVLACHPPDDGSAEADESDIRGQGEGGLPEARRIVDEARSLALARTKDQTCERKAFIDTILEKLRKGIAINERVRDEIKDDETFNKTLKDNLGFHALTKVLDPDQEWRGLGDALGRGVTFFAAAPGFLPGHSAKLEFQPKGKLVVHQLEVSEGRVPSWTEKTGTWSIEVRGGSAKIVAIATQSTGTYALQQTTPGHFTLELESFVDAPWSIFSSALLSEFDSLPTECDG